MYLLYEKYMVNFNPKMKINNDLIIGRIDTIESIRANGLTILTSLPRRRVTVLNAKQTRRFF